MSTKKFISDSVLYKLAGGVPDAGFPISELDVWAELGRKINAKYKLHYVDTTLSVGETMPEHAMIATYEDVAIVSEGEKSYSLLPITPISLPKNMGIYLVYHPLYPEIPLIPLQRGQRGLLRSDELLNDTLGLISYEPKNNKIVYSKDLTTLDFPSVTMELCVMDISQYGINDELPVPADYQDDLIKELTEAFIWVTGESGEVNNWTNINQTQPKK